MADLKDLNLNKSLYKKDKIRSVLPVIDWSSLNDDDNLQPKDNIRGK